MRKPLFLFSLLVITAVLLSACGASASTPDAMMTDGTSTADAMMMHETATADAMMVHEAPTADAMMESPAWLGAALTNVKNGENFTINDFKGKVVLVETMSVSCSDCQSQQNEIQALDEQLGMPDDLVTVSLDIASNENADTLKSYLNGTSFDWLYAVAPEAVSHDLASLYGDQFLNPPSTLILIIDRHGVAHALPFGLKKADELMQAVNMYLKEGM